MKRAQRLALIAVSSFASALAADDLRLTTGPLLNCRGWNAAPNDMAKNFYVMGLTDGMNAVLVALQDRWDRVRQAIAARSVGDYAGMMKTGIVCRKLRSVGHGKDPRVVEEYEIDTAAVEALNSIERRAAIETGQEQENINLNGKISQAGIDAAKVFTIQELEEFERRYEAKAEEERQLKAQAKLLPAPGEK